MKYKAGYKYQLVESYSCEVGLSVDPPVHNDFIRHNCYWLRISKGYAWDGPSGPTFDTKTFMRGSLVHDALYQLMREGLLPRKWRKQADLELWRICRQDGMNRIRAWWVYYAVRLFGGRRVLAKYQRPVHTIS